MSNEEGVKLIPTSVPIGIAKRAGLQFQDVFGIVVIDAIFLSFLVLSFYFIATSNPGKLHNGVDYDGNFCGTSNERMDLSSEPYLYVASPSNPQISSICVEECPDPIDKTTSSFLSDPNSYVCHYRFRDSDGPTKRGSLGRDCWLVEERVTYVHACHIPGSPPILVISGARGYYGDIFEERSLVLLLGGICTAIFAMTLSFLLRIQPSTTLVSTVIFVILALLTFTIILNFFGQQRAEDAGSEKVLFQNLIDVGESMQVLSYITFGFLIFYSILSLIFRNLFQKMTTFLTNMSSIRPAPLDIVPIPIILIQMILAWISFTAIPSIASQSVTKESASNSYFPLSSESAFQIGFLFFCFCWFMVYLNMVAYFVAIYAVSAQIHNSGTNAWTGFKYAFTSHSGTIAIASIFTFLFELPFSFFSWLFPSLYYIMPFNFTYSECLVRSILSGHGYFQSSYEHSQMVFQAANQSDINGFSSKIVCHFSSLSISLLTCSFYLPILIDKTGIGGSLSSVTVPLGLVFVFSFFISNSIMYVIRGGIDACIFSGLPDFKYPEKVIPSSSSSFVNNDGLNNRSTIKGSSSSEGANRIVFDPRDEGERIQRVVIEDNKEKNQNDLRVDHERREQAAAELQFGEKSFVPQ